jgi:inositol-phosphate phosphatase/L-galactose 1-phosphate phosphatase/histidinol-phosphatase
MRNLIEDAYPDHGIIGEEHGTVRTESTMVWVLDPIDGTRSFIAGKPIFGTLIALLSDGEPFLGIIDQPVLGERWVGAWGQHSSFNGEEINTRDCGDLAHAILNTTGPELFDDADSEAFNRLGDKVHNTLYGGDCYAYGLLANGFIDLVVEAQLKPYDFCALIPVVTGAGGAMTDWQGEKLTLESDGRVIAAGDKALHASALKVLSP